VKRDSVFGGGEHRVVARADERRLRNLAEGNTVISPENDSNASKVCM
jgi:hypothetical protein